MAGVAVVDKARNAREEKMYADPLFTPPYHLPAPDPRRLEVVGPFHSTLGGASAPRIGPPLLAETSNLKPHPSNNGAEEQGQEKSCAFGHSLDAHIRLSDACPASSRSYYTQRTMPDATAAPQVRIFQRMTRKPIFLQDGGNASFAST